MKLHELPKLKGSNKAARRVGRGKGSGKGKTSGGGIKGQRVRNRLKKSRLNTFKQFPMLRGKLGRGKNWSEKPATVTLHECNAFDAGITVTKELLVEQGLVDSAATKIKVLGNGTIEKKLTFSDTFLYSNNAREKIDKAGGKIVKTS